MLRIYYSSGLHVNSALQAEVGHTFIYWRWATKKAVLETKSATGSVPSLATSSSKTGLRKLYLSFYRILTRDRILAKTYMLRLLGAGFGRFLHLDIFSLEIVL